MKSKAWILVAVVFWICSAMQIPLVAQTVVAQPQYRFQNFGMNEGLPAENIVSIAQDSLGFIWAQHVGGLSRFDGYNFRVFMHDPNDTMKSLPRGTIGGIISDPGGNIWVTVHTPTQEFPLAKYDIKTDRFIKYRPGVNGSIVNSFRFDKTNPIIWFATWGKGLYSFNLKTLETKNYLNDQPDSSMRERSNQLMDLTDRDSCILVGSAGGLWKFDKKMKTFSRPGCNPADSAFLFNNGFGSIDDPSNRSSGRRGDDNDIWLWGNRILLKVDKNLSVVKRVDFPDGFDPNSYDRDKEGIIWCTTFGNGLFRYNPNDNSFVHIKSIPGDASSLKSDRLDCVQIDKDQNVWIATHPGISRLQRQRLRFYNFNLPGVGESTVYHSVENDFIIINRDRDFTMEILISPIIPDHLDSLIFKPLTRLKGIAPHGLWKGKHNFWSSVYGRGIVQLPINPASGMIISGRHQILNHDPNNANTISSNFTTSVWEDSRDNLLVGTRGSGLNRINLGFAYGSKGSVVRYNHLDNNPNSLSSDIVWNVYPEDEKSFWVVTESGVDLFHDGSFEHVFKNKNTPTSVYRADNGTLFIGGLGGLYEGVQHDRQYVFNKVPLLKIDDVVRIQDDSLGRMWVSNVKGIFCYDRKQQIVIEFNEKDGFDHSRANNPWFREHQTSRGIIVISDGNGISVFDPLSLKVNEARTFPVLTDLRVNNQYPVVLDKATATEEFSIRKNINVLDELVLDYQHNNFVIEFSAMEMTSPEKNRYHHKLESYDKDWIETDWKSRTAAYTNLDAGHYVFKVRASNHHGIWSDQETTLAVHILPPPWKSWWAYSLYGLAFIGIIVSWRRYDIRRVKLKHRAEHLSELDTLKTRFFANISHEFRTPITLILGPLKDMYNGTSKEDPKTVLGPVIRNGQRLLRLINQLLDLSKVEAGKVVLQNTPIELVQFLKEIASSYESLATDKRIAYTFYPEVPELTVYIDPEKIEKVVHNILSNAFKFTRDGEVILNLKVEDKQAVIIVRDTGIGIPAGQLDKVFDRFYQVDSSQTRGYEGSGLGMALSKELVELHHGKISVESEEGKGTTFSVRLPLGKAHLAKGEVIDSRGLKKSRIASEGQILSDDAIEAETEQGSMSSDQPALLIVEDNADMRNYIRKTLSEYYHITEAENGKEGVKMAEEIMPDLIISDIMMPEMDGYQLCAKIKTHELTSHIPVILLTAKADQQSRLTGLEHRADDYLSKPFDGDELRLIVRNHIEERRKMRERFSREITLEPSQISVSSLDEKFLQKVIALIEVHMEEENFSIEDFSQEAGYSRMQFYRKIKALAGQTPSQFVRTIRLKRAAQLLSKKSDHVAQIAYSVGFGSLAYFNKCFKEQFGVTPGQFADGGLKSKV